jgi:hypothetical protein
MIDRNILNDIEIKQLTIKDLINGTQNSVHNDDQIHFRTNKYFHELVKRYIEERGLKTEAEFFTLLAYDYFGRIGWMERKVKNRQYLTAADLEITEEQCNIAMRKINYYKQKKH